jgi:hypothetical protein
MALAVTSTARLPLQRLGTACLASGVLGVIIGALTLAYPADVPDDQWSYPFPVGVGVVLGVVLGVTHLLTLAGYVGVLAVDPHAGRRAAVAALWVAIAGLAGLAVCEVASGAIGGESTDSTAANVLGSLFGLTSLLIGVGSIVAGVAVVRAGRWTGMARWALLASGLILVVLVTPANISGNRYLIYPALMLWSLTFVPLGQVLMRPTAQRR